MAHKISVVSTKGGVGKTTLVANLSGLLADMGLRVLVVDTDVRPQISKFYPLKNPSLHSQRGLFDVMTRGEVSPIAVTETAIPNLDIIVSDVESTDLNVWLNGRMDRDIRLKQSLRCPFVNDNYDIVIIDTGGTSSDVTKAAILAGDEIISPVIPEILSAREFCDGTAALIASLSGSREPAGPVRAIFNKVLRTKDAKRHIDSVREDARALKTELRISVLDTVIPNAKAYTEAATARIPVHRHEPNRDGAMHSAYLVMHQIVWELLSNLKGFYVPIEGAPSMLDSIKTSSENLQEQQV